MPLLVPQALWWIGYAAGSLICAALFLRASAALLPGDRAAASRLIGARSIEEERADELRQRPAREAERLTMIATALALLLA